jgi:hypothetical protein
MPLLLKGYDMAKRFTDSEKFRDPWYRKLKIKHKCLWEYMLSECSHAGILQIDYDSMKFHIGDKIEPKDLDVFKGRIFFLEEDLIFIPKFLLFQYPKGLSRTNKAHNNIFKTLEKYAISETIDIQEIESSFEGPSMVLPRDQGKGKGIGKGLGNGKGIGRGKFNNVYITEEQYESLTIEYLTQSNLALGIEKLSAYIEGSGKKYKSHYAVLGSSQWVYKDIMKPRGSQKLTRDQQTVKNIMDADLGDI